MANVVLGVTGGIAAYKSAQITRALVELGHDVQVITTRNALRFIGSATFEALSGNSVAVVDSEMFSEVEQVKHISVAKKADLILVAPATASFIARVAAGISDDLLSATVLAASSPVIIAPAMHTEMWENEATRSNVATLEKRAIRIIPPGIGRLTGEDSGVGRLADLESIIQAVAFELTEKPLNGKRVLVTAGGTRERIDDARFIGNYSSGKQGIAFAKQAQLLGAHVTLIGCNIETVHGLAKFIGVSNFQELEQEVIINLPETDLLIMAAAVSDFSPSKEMPGKMNRSTLGSNFSIELTQNPDIIKETVSRISENGLSAKIVGFAAESGGNLLEKAISKFESKGCDFLVANDISQGKVFGSESNSVLLIGAGKPLDFQGSKDEVAKAVLSSIADKLSWQ